MAENEPDDEAQRLRLKAEEGQPTAGPPVHPYGLSEGPAERAGTEVRAVAPRAESVEQSMERAADAGALPSRAAPKRSLENIVAGRIERAETPEEAQQWLAVYRGWRSQVAEERHQRWEIAWQGVRWVGAFGAVGLGTWFATHGFDWPGFAIIGSGLSVLAPEYMTAFFHYLERRAAARSEEEGSGESDDGP